MQGKHFPDNTSSALLRGGFLLKFNFRIGAKTFLCAIVLNTIMKKRSFYFFITLLLFQALLLQGCKKKNATEVIVQEPKLTGILSTLQKSHPRLLLTDTRIQELRTLSNTDTKLYRYVLDVLAQAEKDMLKAPIQHVLIGPRMLDQSRECLSRVYNLSFAYRWTGNEKYYNSAIANMKTVCAFADWNPSHFLDVAEMTHAVAIGYDWLYNRMDQPTRDLIKAGLIRLGLNEGTKAYAQNAWWAKDSYNWNQVCNSGLLIGALSIAESDPQLALSIVTKAIDNLPYALKGYGPDGVWCEGPGYWEYASDYTAYGISALKSALGSDFGLTQTPGMSITGYVPMYSTGPTSYMLNYADVGEKSKPGAPHPLMWLANIYNNNHFSDFAHDQLTNAKSNVYHIIWYRPYANSAAKRDLDKYFDGKVALYFSRSSWTDPNALWVGIKSGYNQVNHGHLDLGNFELDALGVRWARDLGSDDYNLPDYFSGTTQTSPRWTYYRLNSFSHNVPVLSGRNQDVNAVATFIKHSEAVAEPLSIIDFTQAYKEFASSAQRGLKVTDDRKSVIIQDEFVLTKASDIAWGMTTDASIEIVNPQKAVLSLNNQKLTARILSPGNAVFSMGSAEQSAPQKLNTGVKRLFAKTPSTTGAVTIIVLLSPQWGGIESSFNPVIKALKDW